MSRGKPLSFDRNAVLEKAMDLFWTKGYRNTGMADLLDHVGIQRQSFYNTFGNKEQVFIEAIRLYSNDMLAQMTVILKNDRHPLENIKELFAFWGTISETKEGRGCMMCNSIAEFGFSDTDISMLLRQQIEKLHELFYQSFSQAKEKGYLSADKDARALATSFITLFQGAALLSRMGFGKESLEDLLRVVEDMLD